MVCAHNSKRGKGTGDWLMKPFDIHQHVNFQPTDGVSQMEEDYDARIPIMDANGIDQAAISTSRYYYRPRE